MSAFTLGANALTAARRSAGRAPMRGTRSVARPCDASRRRARALRRDRDGGEDRDQASPKDGTVRVRFAPSPTGNLHVGGARDRALQLALRAQPRRQVHASRRGHRHRALDARVRGGHGPRPQVARPRLGRGSRRGGRLRSLPQSEREAIYKQLAEQLVEEGYAYPVLLHRRGATGHEGGAGGEEAPPKYTGKWATASAEEVAEEMAKGTPHTYRFRVPEGERVEIDDMIRGKVGWDTDTLGDFVLLRSNGMPVYNFCVAVDDATMGITHVLRAEEHLPNTLRQALVYDALNSPAPPLRHMSLILAPDRSKLSKRHGATSVGQFKDLGYLRDTMINYLSQLGWNDGTEQEMRAQTSELVAQVRRGPHQQVPGDL